MSWVLHVLIGGCLNATVNFGYKTYARQIGIFYLMSGVMAVSAVCMALYGIITQPDGFTALVSGWTPLIVFAMGTGMASVWIIIIKALAKGPLSLVDPLWACIYALGSVAIGIIAAAENPSLLSLLGIVCYLAGAVLMARGDKQQKLPEIET